MDSKRYLSCVSDSRSMVPVGMPSNVTFGSTLEIDKYFDSREKAHIEASKLVHVVEDYHLSCGIPLLPMGVLVTEVPVTMSAVHGGTTFYSTVKMHKPSVVIMHMVEPGDEGYVTPNAICDSALSGLELVSGKVDGDDTYQQIVEAGKNDKSGGEKVAWRDGFDGSVAPGVKQFTLKMFEQTHQLSRCLKSLGRGAEARLVDELVKHKTVILEAIQRHHDVPSALRELLEKRKLGRFIAGYVEENFLTVETGLVMLEEMVSLIAVSYKMWLPMAAAIAQARSYISDKTKREIHVATLRNVEVTNLEVVFKLQVRLITRRLEAIKSLEECREQLAAIANNPGQSKVVTTSYSGMESIPVRMEKWLKTLDRMESGLGKKMLFDVIKSITSDGYANFLSFDDALIAADRRLLQPTGLWSFKRGGAHGEVTFDMVTGFVSFGCKAIFVGVAILDELFSLGEDQDVADAMVRLIVTGVHVLIPYVGSPDVIDGHQLVWIATPVSHACSGSIRPFFSDDLVLVDPCVDDFTTAICSPFYVDGDGVDICVNYELGNVIGCRVVGGNAIIDSKLKVSLDGDNEVTAGLISHYVTSKYPSEPVNVGDVSVHELDVQPGMVGSFAGTEGCDPMLLDVLHSLTHVYVEAQRIMVVHVGPDVRTVRNTDVYCTRVGKDLVKLTVVRMVKQAVIFLASQPVVIHNTGTSIWRINESLRQLYVYPTEVFIGGERKYDCEMVVNGSQDVAATFVELRDKYSIAGGCVYFSTGIIRACLGGVKRINSIPFSCSCVNSKMWK